LICLVGEPSGDRPAIYDRSGTVAGCCRRLPIGPFFESFWGLSRLRPVATGCGRLAP
jgi:hypothetical protein